MQDVIDKCSPLQRPPALPGDLNVIGQIDQQVVKDPWIYSQER